MKNKLIISAFCLVQLMFSATGAMAAVCTGETTRGIIREEITGLLAEYKDWGSKIQQVSAGVDDSVVNNAMANAEKVEDKNRNFVKTGAITAGIGGGLGLVSAGISGVTTYNLSKTQKAQGTTTNNLEAMKGKLVAGGVMVNKFTDDDKYKDKDKLEKYAECLSKYVGVIFNQVSYGTGTGTDTNTKSGLASIPLNFKKVNDGKNKIGNGNYIGFFDDTITTTTQYRVYCTFNNMYDLVTNISSDVLSNCKAEDGNGKSYAGSLLFNKINLLEAEGTAIQSAITSVVDDWNKNNKNSTISCKFE